MRVARRFCTLLKVKRCWQPTDVLDEDWCPIVQVYGVFADARPGPVDIPQAGILLERFGVSLASVLHSPARAVELRTVDKLRCPGLPEFTDECRARVARHVASACRYLHDIGVYHGDLKDSNVLVDPDKGYRAKLTDFGSSKATRSPAGMVGTLFAMAPELFARETDNDLKRVDVYAFAVLLCSLWSSANPQEHFKRILAPELWWNSDLLFDSIGALVRGGLRPDVPPNMPAAYVALMRSCWQHEPFDRPDFGGVCAQLKRMIPACTHTPASRCETRVMLKVQYEPVVTPGRASRFYFEACIEDRKARLRAPTDGDESASRIFCFPFALPEDDTQRTVFLAHTWDEDPGFWQCPGPLGAACPVALPAKRIVGETIQLGHVDVEAAWDTCTALLEQKRHLSTLLVKVGTSTSDANAINLGVLQLQIKAHTPHIVRQRSGIDGFDPEDDPNFVYDVCLSYRDVETGVSGSNFAFRMQEALEEAGYSVFCYASSLKRKRHWVSPFNNGVRRCRVFMPICSPQYADLQVAPWAAAELLQGVQHIKNGQPLILPIRHHGDYPANSDAALMLEGVQCLPNARGPDPYHPVPTARRMKHADVWALVIARLTAAGITPEAAGIVPSPRHAAA